ncbi:hypothetical protein PWT90_08314 [Aphanocladium album]|nr:hypothetical protein PWT90_08314 [Aphanocladium album]
MLRSTLWAAWAYLAAVSVCGADGTIGEKIAPITGSARQNAYRIFNGLHSVARLWGTAVHHNGFALIPGVVPAGTLLYHGSGRRHTPEEREWLAFEVEHAELFAKRFLRPNPPPDGDVSSHKSAPQKRGQKPLAAPPASHSCEDEPDEPDEQLQQSGTGYMHTFQARRDLHVLILDGMSAASSCSSGVGAGGGDVFYLLFRHADGNPDTSFEEECEREENSEEDPYGYKALAEIARRACKVATKLGFDAVLRAEAGFELIYCDFQGTGLELMSSVAQVPFQKRLTDKVNPLFDWMRAVTRNYDGIGRDRLRVDFSSMVSGLFFPFNYSSPLPDGSHGARLMAAGEEHYHQLYEYAIGALHSRDKFTVNWQAVAEAVVDRYSDRLARLASPQISAHSFIEEVEAVVMMYYNEDTASVDRPEAKMPGVSDALDSCTKAYLLPALAFQERWSLADELLYAATETITRSICENYYHVYSLLMDTAPARATKAPCRDKDQDFASKELQNAIKSAQEKVTKLMEKLDWSDWRRPRQCSTNEFMYIAMSPFGTDNDHFNPGCRSPNYFEDLPQGYW